MIPSDGPFGIREYSNPHYLDVKFEFRHAAETRRHRGLLSQFDLWFPSGAAVETDSPDFVSHVGPIDGVMDLREDWSYVLPDGHIHTFSAKYSGCSFSIMVRDSGFLIQCRYHDPDLGSNITVYYPKRFTDLLFLRATKLYFNGSGALDDFGPHDEVYVFID